MFKMKMYIDVQLQGERFEIDIDEDVMRLLKKQAEKNRIPIGRLASELLRKELLMAG